LDYVEYKNHRIVGQWSQKMGRQNGEKRAEWRKESPEEMAVKFKCIRGWTFFTLSGSLFCMILCGIISHDNTHSLMNGMGEMRHIAMPYALRQWSNIPIQIVAMK
jgi:hypothetical protein